MDFFNEFKRDAKQSILAAAHKGVEALQTNAQIAASGEVPPPIIFEPVSVDDINEGTSRLVRGLSDRVERHAEQELMHVQSNVLGAALDVSRNASRVALGYVGELQHDAEHRIAEVQSSVQHVADDVNRVSDEVRRRRDEVEATVHATADHASRVAYDVQRHAEAQLEQIQASAMHAADTVDRAAEELEHRRAEAESTAFATAHRSIQSLDRSVAQLDGSRPQSPARPLNSRGVTYVLDAVTEELQREGQQNIAGVQSSAAATAHRGIQSVDHTLSQVEVATSGAHSPAFSARGIIGQSSDGLKHEAQVEMAQVSSSLLTATRGLQNVDQSQSTLEPTPGISTSHPTHSVTEPTPHFSLSATLHQGPARAINTISHEIKRKAGEEMRYVGASLSHVAHRGVQAFHHIPGFEAPNQPHDAPPESPPPVPAKPPTLLQRNSQFSQDSRRLSVPYPMEPTPVRTVSPRSLSMRSEKSPFEDPRGSSRRNSNLPTQAYIAGVSRAGSIGLQGAGGGGGGDGGGGGRQIDWIDRGSTQRGPKTVEDRMRPTIEYAEREDAKYQRKAQITGYALNIAIGLQVLVGALITGLSAVVSGKNIQIQTSILGGISTVIASYLARVRGSGEPELSTSRAKDLDKFLRETKAFVQDHGYELGHEHDAKIEDYRQKLEELLGNGSGERKLSGPV